MRAYILVNIDVKDPKQLARYQELARPTLDEHGIRLLGKSPAVEVLEGEPPGRMVVVLEADSPEAAQAWYASDAYREAAAARREIATFTTVIVPAH